MRKKESILWNFLWILDLAQFTHIQMFVVEVFLRLLIKINLACLCARVQCLDNVIVVIVVALLRVEESLCCC